jgi:hypothetical protein
VLPFIDSASRHHTDMRPVSLEPVGQGGGNRIKKVFENWLFSNLPIKKLGHQCFSEAKFCFQ